MIEADLASGHFLLQDPEIPLDVGDGVATTLLGRVPVLRPAIPPRAEERTRRGASTVVHASPISISLRRMETGASPSMPSLFNLRSVRGISCFDEGAKVRGATRVPQPAERLGLDLSNALAGHPKDLADLFERVLFLLSNPKAHAQNSLFPG